MFDLIFTNNLSTVKTSTSASGISDHAMIVTDINICHSTSSRDQESFTSSQGQIGRIFNKIKNEISESIISAASHSPIGELWDTFKDGVQQFLDKNIPSKVCPKSKRKKDKRKVQGVPQSRTAALPRPQEEEETDKSKQAQTEQTYEKH